MVRANERERERKIEMQRESEEVTKGERGVRKRERR